MPMNEITAQSKAKRLKEASDDEDDINTKNMLEKSADEIQNEYNRESLADELDKVKPNFKK